MLSAWNVDILIIVQRSTNQLVKIYIIDQNVKRFKSRPIELKKNCIKCQ